MQTLVTHNLPTSTLTLLWTLKSDREAISSSSSRVAEDADILACCWAGVSSCPSVSSSDTTNGVGLKTERIQSTKSFHITFDYVCPILTAACRAPIYMFLYQFLAYIGEGTELSSSSRRLSTLGRTSSIPRASTLRFGFSSTGGPALPAVETPFSWTWWMTLLAGSGGAASSIEE